MSSIKLKHSGGNGVIIAAPANNPAADRTLTCPDLAANATLATVNGITEVDQWYVTANQTSNGDITSLARASFTNSASPLGTGMSQSSGVFTFPNTGKYLVIVTASFSITGGDNVYISTDVSTDGGSSFVIRNYVQDGTSSGTGTIGGGSTSFTFLDVTSTSDIKVKFNALSIASGSAIVGDSSIIRTGFTFIRMGDT